MDNLKQRLVSWIESTLMVPSCGVCEERATGVGPGGADLCHRHAKRRWDYVDVDPPN